MRVRLAALALALVMVASLAAAAPATTAPDGEGRPTADDRRELAKFVTQVVESVRTDDVAATARLFDGKTIAERTYGDGLRQHSPQELAELYTLVARDAGLILHDPPNRASVHSVGTPRFEWAGGPIKITQPLMAADGRSNEWILLVAELDGQWKVIDVGSGSGSITEVTRGVWERNRERSTPAALIRWSAKFADTVSARRRDDASAIARLTTRPATRPATPLPHATAKEAAQAYVNLIQSRKAGEAFDTFWDLDQTARRAFGERWNELSEPQRQRTVELLDEWLRPRIAGAAVEEAMAKLTYRDFQSKSRSDGTVEIAFEATGGGRTRLVRLGFHRGPRGWQIFDQRTAVEPIVETLRAGYGHVPKVMSPLDFLGQLLSREAVDRQALPPTR
jgi:hypothetical protein